MKEPQRHDQTIACPRCYTKMLVRYEARGASGMVFDKFTACLNPQCQHVFVASLLGPFLEGPFALR
jgi:hypothetical protein